MSAARTPATPLRTAVADAAARAGNLIDRRTIHRLWDERTRLVEALRVARDGLRARNAHDNADHIGYLLRELGEDV